MLGLGNSLYSEGSKLEVSFSNNFSMSFDGSNDFIEVDTTKDNEMESLVKIASKIKV